MAHSSLAVSTLFSSVCSAITIKNPVTQIPGDTLARDICSKVSFLINKIAETFFLV